MAEALSIQTILGGIGAFAGGLFSTWAYKKVKTTPSQSDQSPKWRAKALELEGRIEVLEEHKETLDRVVFKLSSQVERDYRTTARSLDQIKEALGIEPQGPLRLDPRKHD